MLVCFVSSSNVHDVQALVVLGGWRAGWHNLCAQTTNHRSVSLLAAAMVKIFEWVSGNVGWGWTGRGQL